MGRIFTDGGLANTPVYLANVNCGWSLGVIALRIRALNSDLCRFQDLAPLHELHCSMLDDVRRTTQIGSEHCVTQCELMVPLLLL